MPTYRVETNQGTFEVESDREPTVDDIQRHLGGGAPAKAPVSDNRKYFQGPDSFDLSNSGEVTGATPDNARLNLASTARYGGALIGSEGGATGAGLTGGGEALAQLIEGGNIRDPGAVGKAATVGAIPLGKAAGIVSALKNAGKVGLGAAAGTEVQSLINDGKLADGATVAKDATIGAAIPLGASAVAKVATKLPGVGRSLGVVDPQDAAKMAEAKLNNTNKDAVLAAMKARGAVAVPSSVNPSAKNQLLESIAGIQNVEGGVARKNQPVFNAIGREEASLSPTTPINETTLADARSAIAKDSYDKARQYGFGQELDDWRSASTKLKEAEKKVQGAYTTARGQAVDDAEKAVADAETALTAKAQAAGDPDALKVLKEAKTAFAKNYDVEQAVLSGTDEVRPAVLSGMLEQRGEAGMTGGLRDVAQFQNAFGRSAKNPTKLATAPGAAGPGMALAATGGNPLPAAALTGGLYGVRKGVRDMLVSDAYQAKNAIRNYDPKVNADPAMIAGIIRELQMASIARKKKEEGK